MSCYPFGDGWVSLPLLPHHSSTSGTSRNWLSEDRAERASTWQRAHPARNGAVFFHQWKHSFCQMMDEVLAQHSKCSNHHLIQLEFNLWFATVNKSSGHCNINHRRESLRAWEVKWSVDIPEVRQKSHLTENIFHAKQWHGPSSGLLSVRPDPQLSETWGLGRFWHWACPG